MKSTGIVRNIDELGRIVIPKEMRNKMNFKNADPIEIYVEDDKIILKKYDAVCLFCGNAENLIEFKGKKLCTDCVDAMSKAR